MDYLVLDDIAFQPNLEHLFQQLRLSPSDPSAAEARRSLEEGARRAKPKAVYRPAQVEGRDRNSVKIDGVTFTSRVMAVNLEHAPQVFCFSATCGRELESWAQSVSDPWQGFAAQALMNQALFTAVGQVIREIQERFCAGPTSIMNPGSLQDWPLSEQKPLFALLGNGPAQIGVTLLESCFMAPALTVSGIIYPTSEHFESCMLCAREKCPRRRADYDPGLWEKKYHEGKL